MNAAQFIASALTDAHMMFDQVVAELTPDQLHWTPPGTATPIGANYAHVIVIEDIVIAGIMGTPPLGAGAWAERTGLSEPMPAMGPEWADYGAWSRRVQVDLAAMQPYAEAVYAQSAAYLAQLDPAQLEQPCPMPGFEQSLAWVLSSVIVAHINQACGEIAALKGVQGLRGYTY